MIGFFDYKIAESLNEVGSRVEESATGFPVVVNCMNPHSFVMALDDVVFQESLAESDILLPDGEGVCWAIRKQQGRKINKIAGDDLHRYLIEMAEKKNPSVSPNGRVYYMGSSDSVLSMIVDRLESEYPSITVRTYSPPFCTQLPDDESRKIVDDINAFAPDIVFVGMGAPKQEKWTRLWAEKMNGVKVVANIGAVFEFYSGTRKRASQWIVRLKLEWLVRLVKEPRRMWKRTFVSAPRFMRHVRKELQNKKFKNQNK